MAVSVTAAVAHVQLFYSYFKTLTVSGWAGAQCTACVWILEAGSSVSSVIQTGRITFVLLVFTVFVIFVVLVEA